MGKIADGWSENGGRTDCVKRIEGRKNKPKLMGFFSHHKCGSQWLFTVIHKIGKKLKIPVVVLDHSVWKSLKEQRDYRYTEPLITLLGNLTLPFVAGFHPDHFRGIHMMRDPRDILVSAYYSHLYSHSVVSSIYWMRAQRFLLQGVSKEEGMLSEFDFFLNEQTLRTLDAWNFGDERFKTVKFEDLITNSVSIWTDMFDFVGLSFPKEDLVRVLDSLSFRAMSEGRSPGNEDQTSHYRKGVPGDYKNHFTKRIAEKFQDEWGHLLIKFDYAKDGSWVDECTG